MEPKLTKLEYATIHIYEGMIASLDGHHNKKDCMCEQMCDMAIHGAHLLLNKLHAEENHHE